MNKLEFSLFIGCFVLISETIGWYGFLLSSFQSIENGKYVNYSNNYIYSIKRNNNATSKVNKEIM
jgi:hypothetical protein